MDSDWGRSLVKSSLLSSAFFLIEYVGSGLLIGDIFFSINVVEIAFAYIFTVPIYFILGIPLTLCIKKLVRNIRNKIIKELLSQVLVTLLAFSIIYFLTEFLFGGAYLSKDNIVQSILFSYFSAIAALIGIRLSKS